jgi:hypothetical protein
MITGKVSWEEVRPLIEKETGPVRVVSEIPEGRNSEISVLVHAEIGTTFVKGRKADHPQAWTQEREKLINPSVRQISPNLKWSASSDDWNLLGFEYVSGFKVDYSPGSPDILQVIQVILELQEIPCPDVEIKKAEQRWSDYTETPEILAGGSLLHTEWSPGNVLIGDRAYLVDWAWPTRGAAWIDPACWAVWLIASGHTPDSAESLAGCIPSWRNAPPRALDEFARVQALMWSGIAAESSESWTQSLATASAQWAAYRDGPGNPS